MYAQQAPAWEERYAMSQWASPLACAGPVGGPEEIGLDDDVGADHVDVGATCRSETVVEESVDDVLRQVSREGAHDSAVGVTLGRARELRCPAGCDEPLRAMSVVEDEPARREARLGIEDRGVCGDDRRVAGKTAYPVGRWPREMRASQQNGLDAVADGFGVRLHGELPRRTRKHGDTAVVQSAPVSDERSDECLARSCRELDCDIGIGEVLLRVGLEHMALVSPKRTDRGVPDGEAVVQLLRTRRRRCAASRGRERWHRSMVARPTASVGVSSVRGPLGQVNDQRVEGYRRRREQSGAGAPRPGSRSPMGPRSESRLGAGRNVTCGAGPALLRYVDTVTGSSATSGVSTGYAARIRS